MRMMQVSVHEVIDVVAMRHSFVATVGAMNVVSVVLSRVIWRAGIRVLVADRDHMLIDVIAVRMMQVPIVQVVHVAVVFDRRVPTALAVLVFVVVAGMEAVFVVHVCSLQVV